MKIVDFIICDDIRYEIGNKVTLVGIYNDSIVFGEKNLSDIKWPKAMKVGIYLRSLFTPEEPVPNKFVINIHHNGEKKLSLPGALKRIDGKKEYLITVAVVADNFSFHGVGSVSFEIKYFQNDKLVAEAVPANKIIVQVSLIPEAVAL